MSALLVHDTASEAQTVSQQGFVEARAVLFAAAAPNDITRAIGDALLREEVFVAPAEWVRLAGGLDLRVNSHRQVEDEWRFDVEDRELRRPRVSLRRLSTTLSGGGFSIELGKQFIRWARTDVLNPLDRFAPRDFLNVIDFQYLPVIAARPSLEIGSESFEGVWVPQVTPSRMPLLDQRWTVVPPEAAGLAIRDDGARYPKRAQYGARWRHTGGRLEAGLAYFDGLNHFPHIEGSLPSAEPIVSVVRVFPRLRMYGGDFAVPAAWFTIKGEAGYFRSPDRQIADYGLYVLELERQAGEWLLTAGYAGEVAVATNEGLAAPLLSFDPERGLARSIIGRAAYTVDPRRTVTFEGAVRQNADGVYLKGDYSQAMGQHVRLTVTGVALAGTPHDFLGQFDRNSHVSTGIRVSF